MKDSLTEHFVANKIRMNRSVDNRVVVLTEGGTDAKLFSFFCDAEFCCVESARDRNTALQAVELLNKDQFPDFLAVVDADFCRILGTCPNYENVFLTDSHDIETMIMTSSALDRVVLELGSTGKIKSFSDRLSPMIANVVFKISSPIGALRLASVRDDLKISFKGLRFLKFVDRDTDEINVVKFVDEVCRKNSGLNYSPDKLLRLLNSVLRENLRLPNLCNGHDCIEILRILLTKRLGNQDKTKLTKDVLERALRLAFSEDCFVRTQLYALLKTFETRVSTNRIIRQPMAS